MNEPTTPDLKRLYGAKIAEELACADLEVPGSECNAWAGNPFGDLMLVKGMPGPAEAEGGTALSGPDGEAASAALTAMGFDPTLAFKTLSRPVAAEDAALARRLRLQIGAVDPRYIIALDRVAAIDVANAFELSDLAFGAPVQVRGHRVLAVDGLEESLGDGRHKRRIWSQLKRLEPDGPVW